jgi:hypothetical protein
MEIDEGMMSPADKQHRIKRCGSSANIETYANGDEVDEEVNRYRENFAHVTRIKKDMYSGLDIMVDVRADSL